MVDDLIPPHQTLSLKVVDLNTAQGTFAGYGAVFGNLDRAGDIIEPGAFTATLSDARARQAATKSPCLYPLLWMHEPTRPVGCVSVAREDAKGLYIAGRCDLGTDAGRAAFSGLQQGYSNSFSIGYQPVKAMRDPTGARHLLSVNLTEISLVTAGFAANELALVEAASVKSTHAAADRTFAATLEGLAQEMRAWLSDHEKP